MPFEDVWMEATHTCVFFYVLVGLIGIIWVLEKLSLIFVLDDIVKAYHVSNSTEFMWWGWNLDVSYFIIHLAFGVL